MFVLVFNTLVVENKSLTPGFMSYESLLDSRSNDVAILIKSLHNGGKYDVNICRYYCQGWHPQSLLGSLRPLAAGFVPTPSPYPGQAAISRTDLIQCITIIHRSLVAHATYFISSPVGHFTF